jgi:hypothetical protein
MMQPNQLSLFDPRQPVTKPDYTDCATIAERFELFHARNPQVYAALRSMALELCARGHQKYGIKALFEVLRFNAAMQTHGDTFKLNNDFTALYARLLMDQEPELEAFFEIRQRTADPAHVV